MKAQLRVALKGALRPPENDSAFLLDRHRRGVPGRERMRRFESDDPVDMLIIGAGAGGATLAQRLARRGWSVLVLEAGPFWDPDEDWVSDEAGAHSLYWTEERIIGGEDPVELGKNNSGRGVGGSMIHYAGYTPRFHPSDFEVRSARTVSAPTGRSATGTSSRTTNDSSANCLSPASSGRGGIRTATRTDHIRSARARSAHGMAPSAWG